MNSPLELAQRILSDDEADQAASKARGFTLSTTDLTRFKLVALVATALIDTAEKLAKAQETIAEYEENLKYE